MSSERVRQLVVAGDLPGVRFGNAWAVPRDSITARRQVSNRRGRPLSARRAWESIAAADIDLSNVSRYRNRGEVHRYEMSAADLEFVLLRDGAMVSGVVAASVSVSCCKQNRLRPTSTSLLRSITILVRWWRWSPIGLALSSFGSCPMTSGNSSKAPPTRTRRARVSLLGLRWRWT